MGRATLLTSWPHSLDVTATETNRYAEIKTYARHALERLTSYDQKLDAGGGSGVAFLLPSLASDYC
jgi:hypothetical protein